MRVVLCMKRHSVNYQRDHLGYEQLLVLSYLLVKTEMTKRMENLSYLRNCICSAVMNWNIANLNSKKASLLNLP